MLLSAWSDEGFGMQEKKRNEAECEGTTMEIDVP
jgi:hypothetical protein